MKIDFTSDETKLIKSLVNSYYCNYSKTYFRFTADYGPLEKAIYNRRCSILLSILAKVDPQYTIPEFGGYNSEQEV